VNAGKVTNTAMASGTPSSGPTVTSAPSSATVIATAAPALTLVKTEASGSPDPVTSAAQSVTYDFKVTNTGNVILSAISVTDTQGIAGETLTSAPTCPTTTLAPSVAVTCTATFTVTQANIDAGTLTDTATATGTAPDGTTATSNRSSLSIPATQTPTSTPPPSPSSSSQPPHNPNQIVTGSGSPARRLWLLFGGFGFAVLAGLAFEESRRRRREAL
jgi:hypothetical protein